MISMFKKDYKNSLVRWLAGGLDLAGWFFLDWKVKPKVDPLKINRITLVKLDRIGDAILSTPVLETLAKMFPHAELTMIVAPWNKEVFENNPFVRRIEVFEDASDVHASSKLLSWDEAQAKKLAEIIKDHKPDVGIDLQGSPTIVYALKAAKVPIRAGFAPKVLAFMLTHRAKYSVDQHQSEIYLSLARALGYDGQAHEPRFFVPLAKRAKASAIFSKLKLKNFLVFHLGSGRNYRQWPLKHFTELAKRVLAQDKNIKLILIGGKEDLPLAEDLTAKTGEPKRILNLIGKLSLSGTHELLSKASGFVGSESGPMHVAALAHTPSLVMMNGWSGISRWRPLNDKAVVLEAKKIHICAGPKCYLKPCPNMAAITVKEAEEALMEILGKPSGGRNLVAKRNSAKKIIKPKKRKIGS